MKFRLTSLTPLLVGDGQKLSPIDYMVWKDHVNVLDQKRIFRLLAKGPRLDSYLSQIKKADRLDFASWGGFAQNYAGRRIPFEHPSAARFLDKARIESLHIPTFSSGPAGPFLPGTAIKGALRTAMVFRRADEKALRELAAKAQDRDRPLRRPGEALEQPAVGTGGTSRMRVIETGDSRPVPAQLLKIYLLRVATLQQRGDRMELGWKQGAATVDAKRVDESTPWFAEMASPGTVFEGTWSEPEFFKNPEIVRAIHWGRPPDRTSIFSAANDYAGRMLDVHRRYSEQAGLTELSGTLDRLAKRLETARESDTTCLLCLGWGGGFVSKSAFPEASPESYRQLLQQVPLYSKALRSGMPFPKTRRVVFEGNQPSSLPGWALLEIE
jgi:CRISPR-associated protein Csm5